MQNQPDHRFTLLAFDMDGTLIDSLAAIVEASVEVTRVVETPVEQSVPNTPSINPMMPIEFDTIESSVTGREYAITIALPLSYMFSDADYPVIYVTDGDFYEFR